MNRLKKIFNKKSEEPLQDTVKENRHLSHEHSHSENGYQCPMKCEGDKIYEAPGNCPVCKMKLIPVNSGKLHDNHHH